MARWMRDIQMPLRTPVIIAAGTPGAILTALPTPTGERFWTQRRFHVQYQV